MVTRVLAARDVVASPQFKPPTEYGFANGVADWYLGGGADLSEHNRSVVPTQWIAVSLFITLFALWYAGVAWILRPRCSDLPRQA